MAMTMEMPGLIPVSYTHLSIKDDGTPGDPDKVALSYNQGTFMAAALELYNATGEDLSLIHI